MRTPEEVARETLGCKQSAIDFSCLTHNEPGGWGNRGPWPCVDRTVLEAASLIRKRDAEVAARTLMNYRDAILDNHASPYQTALDVAADIPVWVETFIELDDS